MDTQQSRLVTGAADGGLRLYSIAENLEEPKNDDGQVEALKSMGSIKRETTEKVQMIRFSSQHSSLLACMSASKKLEIYRLLSEEERQKKAKRRMKRKREKSKKRKTMEDNEDEDEVDDVETESNSPEIIANDEIRPLTTISLKSKLKYFSFAPEVCKHTLLSCHARECSKIH